LFEQLVSKISNLCDPDPPTSQTDGQTDAVKRRDVLTIVSPIVNKTNGQSSAGAYKKIISIWAHDTTPKSEIYK